MGVEGLAVSSSELWRISCLRFSRNRLTLSLVCCRIFALLSSFASFSSCFFFLLQIAFVSLAETAVSRQHLSASFCVCTLSRRQFCAHDFARSTFCLLLFSSNFCSLHEKIRRSLAFFERYLCGFQCRACHITSYHALPSDLWEKTWYWTRHFDFAHVVM